MKVKLYVSEHCRRCSEVRQYFAKKGIQTEEVDVTHDQTKFDEMLSLGGIATPLIVIEDQVVHNCEPAKLDKIMEGFH